MQTILEYYPFLEEIPEDDLASLDLNVLSIPTPLESTTLCQVSSAIDKNIVIYNKFHSPNGNHLCRYLKFAKLNEREFFLVSELEEKFGSGKVIVAYEKPLTFSQ